MYTVRRDVSISRYGKLYRGNKIRHCQDAGAVGVILFSDPAEVAPNGVTKDKVKIIFSPLVLYSLINCLLIWIN